MKILLTITLLLTITTSLAGEMENLKQLNQHQQQMQQLLDDIKISEQQRDEQKAVLENLEKQMECNWTLIQSYETCEQLYPRASQELLDCTAKAKANAVKCLTPTRQ